MTHQPYNSGTSVTLTTGVRHGHYEIVAPLGKGGMGEVYRARDLRLGRDVAIKVLAYSLASDPERVRRFAREARVLAALNHPHIGAIYGLEEIDSLPALVLELVEGPTLADQLGTGPLPLKEALVITRQIAEALDAAHEKGIIHRDLKPANIKVREDGTVKLLDFGLAKAFVGDGPGADLSQLPTVTLDRTVEGFIAGTPAYMSPEQARGQVVDKRADVWAFGCVFYEMLTGQAAFSRETITDTLAAILEREPDWQALPELTPVVVRRLLKRCLTKDPDRRPRDLGDLSLELEDAVEGSTRLDTAARAQPRRRSLSLSLGAAIVVLTALAGAYRWRAPTSDVPSRPQVTRLTMTLDAPDWLGLNHPTLVWSPGPEALPDGTSVLYTVMPTGEKPASLAVASLTTGQRKLLTEGSAAHYLSTGHLVYLLGSSLMGVRFDPQRLEVLGTPVKLLDDVQQDQRAGAAQFAVSSGGNLVYVSRVGRNSPRRLVVVDRFGQAEAIAPPARTYGNPRVSPDGQRIVVDVQGPTGSDVWIHDMSRATWSQLTFNGQSRAPIWTPDGKRVTFSVSSGSGSQLYWKAADGSSVDELLSADDVDAGNPHSWSPDGRWLVRTGPNASGGSGSQIMLISADEGVKTRPFLLKLEGTEMAAPAISPNGRFIAYVANDSGRRQVYVRRFPSGDGRWLVSSTGGTQPMWARDGRELFYRDSRKMMAVNVTTDPVFKADTARPLFEGDFEIPAVRANYDVMGDGRHFVMVKADEQELVRRRLNIVLNWGEELKRRIPAR